jgi:hypothetical protein
MNTFEDHERYVTQAKIIQDLKRVITHHVADLDRKLDDDVRETLDTISHAIGLIIEGNATNQNIWLAIVDSALLIANKLEAAKSEIAND